MAHPNQPANVRDMPSGALGFQVGSHRNKHETQIQGVSTVHMPFDEFEPMYNAPGMCVGSGDMALDTSFDHSIPSQKPSRVMPPGLSKSHDNESMAHASAQRNPKLIYDIKRVNWDPP
eukprot:1110122-Prymnesium_polylepis.1